MNWTYTRNVSLPRENTRKWNLTRHWSKTLSCQYRNSEKQRQKSRQTTNTGPVSPTEATAFSVCLMNSTDYQTPLWYVHLK